MTDTTTRTAFTRGLREIADFLDAHPDVRVPHFGDPPALTIWMITGDGRPGFVDQARRLGAEDLVQRGSQVFAGRAFAGLLRLEVGINRGLFDSREPVQVTPLPSLADLLGDAPDVEGESMCPLCEAPLVVGDSTDVFGPHDATAHSGCVADHWVDVGRDIDDRHEAAAEAATR